jgi:hypothetical protein
VLWSHDVLAGVRHRVDNQYHELRYEDLVCNTEPTLRALVAFLEIPWSDALFEASGEGADADEVLAASEVNTISIGKWVVELSSADLATLRTVIGPLLIDLGYASALRW